MKTEKLYNLIRPILYRLKVIDLAYKVLTPNMRATIARRTGLGDYISPLPPRDRFSGRINLDGINYIADLRADIGVGEASRGIYAGLVASGLPLDYFEIITPLVTRTHEAPEPVTDHGPRYGLTFVNANAPEMRIAFQQYPHSFKDRYVIAYWHWEVPRFPKRWLSRMDIVDEIWVGSRYTQQILANIGTVPVRTMPTPIRKPTVTLSREEIRSRFGIPTDRFMFFYAFNPGSSMARKNPYGFIEAYRKAFGDSSSADKPLLVIKAHHLNDPMHQPIAGDLRAAVAEVGGILIDQHLSRDEMNALLNACDCYVSLHRAEGYGLSIAEAMVLGKPVIATAYSANTDFMTEENSYGVGYTLRPITLEDHALQPSLQPIYAPGENQVWAEPDLEQTVAMMRHVVEHPDDAHQRGERAAHDIATKLSVQAIGERMRVQLEELALTEQPESHPSL
jgi:glycosyltransferase involved in cell wall biosynthesis